MEGVGAALAAVRRTYAEATGVTIEDARLTEENVLRITERWMREHQGLLPWAVAGAGVAFEQQLEAPLTEQLTFVGLLDGLVRSKTDGLFYVLEHKTTKSINAYWMAQWVTAAQISGYVWLASQHLSNPVVGAFLNAIEIQSEPKVLTRKCRIHGVPYAECKDEHQKSEIRVVSRSKMELERWQRTAISLGERFLAIKSMYSDISAVRASAPQEGRFVNACQWCEFKDWCALGRPANMLTKDPWEPIQAVAVEGEE